MKYWWIFLILLITGCKNKEYETSSNELCVRTVKSNPYRLFCQCRRFKLSNKNGNNGFVWLGKKYKQPKSYCNTLVGMTLRNYAKFRADLEEIAEDIGDASIQSIDNMPPVIIDMPPSVEEIEDLVIELL